jgi:hypothetical protein
MALELSKVRDALIEAGASPKAASEAAQEIANYETASLRADIKLLQWMVGTLGSLNLALTAGVIWRLLAH